MYLHEGWLMSKRLIVFFNKGETFMIIFSKNGGRKMSIAAILLSLICLFTLINMSRIKADTLDGVVIKIQDSCILMDSLDENEPGPVRCHILIILMFQRLWREIK